MANSILEAVKIGLWNFLPHTVDYSELEAADDMPGTREKLDILADHLRRQLPVWNFDDASSDTRGRETSGASWSGRRPRPR